jgi:hypothetical protein
MNPSSRKLVRFNKRNMEKKVSKRRRPEDVGNGMRKRETKSTLIFVVLMFLANSYHS